MQLYYDTLIPYMPDAVANDAGELISDMHKAAGRKAMGELANFQNTKNTLSLYQAVIYACTYADVDLVDTILEVSNPEGGVAVPSGPSAEYMVDTAAKLLFSSIKPSVEFDYKLFVALLLTAIHLIMQRPAAEPTEVAAPEPVSE